jgi:hypothetical protein
VCVCVCDNSFTKAGSIFNNLSNAEGKSSKAASKTTRTASKNKQDFDVSDMFTEPTLSWLTFLKILHL